MLSKGLRRTRMPFAAHRMAASMAASITVFGALVLTMLATPVYAAPERDAVSDEEAILAVVHALFDAMRAGDGEAVRAVFREDAQMFSVVVRDGVAAPQAGSLEGFVNAVGQPRDEVWDEQIWDPVIHIDGDLATAWTPYAFYRGDTFSHCGANSFQFVKGPDGWKIAYIIDSRRRDDCQIPDAVRDGR